MNASLLAVLNEAERLEAARAAKQGVKPGSAQAWRDSR